MRIIEYETQMAEGDRRLTHIENIIEKKRQYLLEKQKKLKHLSESNKFLHIIKNDYDNYYNYIIKQKEDQIKALDILNQYINELSESGELSKNNLYDSKYEQKRILNEINHIKNNLDTIIKNTSEIDRQTK